MAGQLFHLNLHKLLIIKGINRHAQGMSASADNRPMAGKLHFLLVRCNGLCVVS